MKMRQMRLIPMICAAAIIGCGGRENTGPQRPAGHGAPVSPETTRIRPPAVAGAFYDGDPRTLDRKIDKFLENAKKVRVDGRLAAAIVPHAGYTFSGRCAASVYSLVSSNSYRRVIILGPTHSYPFRGIAVPEEDIAAHRTPFGDIPIDRDMCRELLAKEGFSTVPGADAREHSIEVQYPFLQKKAGSFKLVPLLCGVMSDSDIDGFAAALAPYLDDKTLLIASSDFTHYGRRFQFVPFTDDIRDNLYKWLERVTGIIARLDVKGFDDYLAETHDTICGRTPIRILMRTLKNSKMELKGKVLDYYSSGDVVGDFRDCVSYGAVGFFAAEPDPRDDRSPDRK